MRRTDRLYAVSAALALDETVRHLNVVHLRILATLCGAQAPLSVTALAAVQSISKPLASRAVDRLVTHGLAVREEHSLDRRLMDVSITDKGRAAHTRAAVILGFADPVLQPTS